MVQDSALAADSLTVIACELGVSLGRCRMLADRVEQFGQWSAATPLRMGLELIEESLLRLGVPFSGEAQDAQDHPLVLSIETRVGPDQ